MYDTCYFFIQRVRQDDFQNIVGCLTGARETTDTATGEVLATVGSLNNMKVSVSMAGLSVKGSLCKFYLPDNTFTLSRNTTKDALTKLSDSLHIDFDEAKLTRIDVSTHFIMSKPAPTYYPFLGLCTHYQRTQATAHTLYYNNMAKDLQRTMVFYDKLPEVEARDGITPDVFVGENLLRYESRWVRRLPQQLRVSEVKGRTLYDATFYHYIIDLWAKNYFSIQKIKKQKNESMNEIKDVKSAANYIISVALQRLPPDEVQNLLEEMKAKRVFRDAKYYTRLRQKLKNITTNSKMSNESDQIRELDNEVKQILAYKV